MINASEAFVMSKDSKEKQIIAQREANERWMNEKGIETMIRNAASVGDYSVAISLEGCLYPNEFQTMLREEGYGVMVAPSSANFADNLIIDWTNGITYRG